MRICLSSLAVGDYTRRGFGVPFTSLLSNVCGWGRGRSVSWTVRFRDDSGIDDDESQGAIRTALRGVASKADPERGYWPATVADVLVTRRLAGGRSGSEVLEIEVKDTAGRTYLQVAKLADLKSTAQEWDRARQADLSERFPLFTRVVAVSRDVLEPPKRPLVRRQVLVYQHVCDRDPWKGEIRSLLDVVESGLAGEDESAAAGRTLRRVFQALSNQLHRDRTMQSQDLLAFNRSLGKDLYVSFDSYTAETSPVDLMHGTLADEQIQASQCDDTAILQSSTAAPGGEQRLRSGDLVAMRLENVQVHDHHLVGTFGDTEVRVEAVNAASKRPIGDLLGQKISVEICGEVQRTRADVLSERLRRFLDGVDEAKDGLTYQGVRVAHPLRRLHQILSGHEERTLSPVHGDLNPHNLVLAGENPYLIDLAAAAPNQATLSDYGWLEVCTLRDLPQCGMGFAELVQMQRVLAALTALSTELPEDAMDGVATAVTEAVSQDSPAQGRFLRMLWECRRAAMLVNDQIPAPRADRHLLQHLTLSALRSLKFDDEDQSEYRVAASTSIAAVAAEAVDGLTDAFFTSWPPRQAEALRAALLNLEDLPTRAADLLADVHLVLRGFEDTEDRDAAVIRALFQGPLREATPKRPPVNPYIPLVGRLLQPGEPLAIQGKQAPRVTPPEAVDVLLEQRQVVLIGDTGAGKSTIAKELQSRMVAPSPDLPDRLPHWPVSISAFQVGAYLKEHGSDWSPAGLLAYCVPVDERLEPCTIHRLSRLGAVHLVIDDLHAIDVGEKATVLACVQRIAEQYPLVRLVVCQRSWDYDPGVLHWPAVAVYRVRKHDARIYLEERLRSAHPRTWRPRMKQLDERIFDDGADVAVRDLAMKPLFLSMLVHHYAQAEQIASNTGTLVHDYLRRLLKTRDQAEQQRRLQLLQVLVQNMEQYGSALRYQDAVQCLSQLQPADVDSTLKALQASGILEADPSGDWLSFCNPVVQSFCAAGFLQYEASTNLPAVLERVTEFRWRDAAQLLVAKPDADPQMVRAVLETALEANTAYGAWLLAAAAGDFNDLHAALLSNLKHTLESPDSGTPAWYEAADTLARYGWSAAVEILESVARTTEPESAVGAALSGLVLMRQWSVPGAEATLTSVLRSLLDCSEGRGKPDLTVRALQSAAAAGLTTLAGLVWERVNASEPWTVVREAWRALGLLHLAPSRQLRSVYASACEARLAEVSLELRQSAAHAEIHRLNTERMDLLRALADEGFLHTLLGHRFSVGLADHGAWDDLFRAAANARRLQCPADEQAQLIAQSAHVTEARWIELLQGTDDEMAAIAAHHLLQLGCVISGAELTSTAMGASSQRLLTLAAFVHGFDPHDIALVEEAVQARCQLPLTPEDLEPLSAVVAGVGRSGVELQPGLALTVDRAVRASDMPQARCWPWASTWREAMPDPLDTGTFVDSAELSDPELLTVLGTSDVLLDAPEFDPMPLTFEQRERLLQIEVGDPTSLDAHRLVLLAASAGLHEHRTFVLQVAENVTNTMRLINHSHPVHGLVQVSMAAHAVSAFGYLSALAVSEGAAKNTKAAHKTLTQLGLSTDGMHPSLERARLIALGFLGDWEEVLGSLTADDPIMHQAAINLASRMFHDRDPDAARAHAADVAEWIKDRLKDEQPPAAIRAVLTRIRHTAEFTLRRYVL
ncbi:hypothetical protein [Streptomyces sp. NPDC093225]|uniref:hypothetical protein n=1 Tax=Streptomyces sp. NPDC093225 TaxID=3366034 RepID=UPI00380618A9